MRNFGQFFFQIAPNLFPKCVGQEDGYKNNLNSIEKWDNYCVCRNSRYFKLFEITQITNHNHSLVAYCNFLAALVRHSYSKAQVAILN